MLLTTEPCLQPLKNLILNIFIHIKVRFCYYLQCIFVQMYNVLCSHHCGVTQVSCYPAPLATSPPSPCSVVLLVLFLSPWYCLSRVSQLDSQCAPRAVCLPLLFYVCGGFLISSQPALVSLMGMYYSLFTSRLQRTS